MRDPEHELLEQRRAWAHDAGLPGIGVADIFSAILQLSRGIQTG